MCWVYQKIMHEYVVGYYTPAGNWREVKSFQYESDAMRMVSFMNGGTSTL